MADHMLAYRLVDWQRPELVEVPVPVPGPDQVLVRVGAAGLCGTDLKLIAVDGGPFAPPYTLGHEIAGWIEGGADDGAGVAVSPMSWCGQCWSCLRGATNYCTGAGTGRGFGIDGGMAGYVAVDRRHVLPIGDLEPRSAAPLTDAAATAYHAVRLVRPRLVPGATAVVIGAGGLGGYAVQLLALTAGLRVVVIETNPIRRAFAEELGAEVVLPGEDVDADIDAVRTLTGGVGADAVLDFVGFEPAVRTAMGCVRSPGSMALVGGGGGSVPFGHTTLPRGVDITSPTGASISDLHEVVALARSGRLRIETEAFPLTDVTSAFDALRAGDLRSRAVVLP